MKSGEPFTSFPRSPSMDGPPTLGHHFVYRQLLFRIAHARSSSHADAQPRFGFPPAIADHAQSRLGGVSRHTGEIAVPSRTGLRHRHSRFHLRCRPGKRLSGDRRLAAHQRQFGAWHQASCRLEAKGQLEPAGQHVPSAGEPGNRIPHRGRQLFARHQRAEPTAGAAGRPGVCFDPLMLLAGEGTAPEPTSGGTLLLRTASTPSDIESVRKWAAEAGVGPAEAGLRIAYALARIALQVIEAAPPAGLMCPAAKPQAPSPHHGLGALEVGRNVEPGLPVCRSLGRFGLPAGAQERQFRERRLLRAHHGNHQATYVSRGIAFDARTAAASTVEGSFLTKNCAYFINTVSNFD